MRLTKEQKANLKKVTLKKAAFNKDKTRRLYFHLCLQLASSSVTVIDIANYDNTLLVYSCYSKRIGS
jgi:hypothetical protein